MINDHAIVASRAHHQRRMAIMNFSLGTRPISRGAKPGLFATLCALLAVSAASVSRADKPPTPEEYIAHVGGDARLVPPGQLVFDRRKLSCGQRPTVLDSQLDDFGAAYPGFLIFNPRLMAKVSIPVKMWIHAHECGHQFRGPDEETADCFAVQRGRREGWLSTEGVEEVCKFIAPAKGDSMHFSGANRCDYMRKCYADPKVH